MLAILSGLLLAAPPDFSKVNSFGPMHMELPLDAAKTADGSYSGSDQGVEFHLAISPGTDTSARRAEEVGSKLKTGAGVKSFRGGSTLPVHLGPGNGFLLRYNLLMQDGRELITDELLIPVEGQTYDFQVTADRHDAHAVAWLSRAYASLRADTHIQKDLKVEAFGNDGLLWQTWSSKAMRVQILVPHTPYTFTETASDAEASRREADYADDRYGIRFKVTEMKDAVGQSVDALMRDDLRTMTVSDGNLVKPDAGKWRSIDGAPASIASCSVVNGDVTRRLILLDVVKDKVVYRFWLSAPTSDDDASRKIDQIVESIKLLPASS